MLPHENSGLQVTLVWTYDPHNICQGAPQHLIFTYLPDLLIVMSSTRSHTFYGIFHISHSCSTNHSHNILRLLTSPHASACFLLHSNSSLSELLNIFQKEGPLKCCRILNVSLANQVSTCCWTWLYTGQFHHNVWQCVSYKLVAQIKFNFYFRHITMNKFQWVMITDMTYQQQNPTQMVA